MRLPERGLRWSIRSIEWMRRLIGGIKEFGDNPDAVFRLAIGKADREESQHSWLGLPPHTEHLELASTPMTPR